MKNKKHFIAKIFIACSLIATNAVASDKFAKKMNGNQKGVNLKQPYRCPLNTGNCSSKASQYKTQDFR